MSSPNKMIPTIDISDQIIKFPIYFLHFCDTEKLYNGI